MDDSAIMCDEIIDVEAKSNNKTKSNEEETKSVPTNFNEKSITMINILQVKNLTINSRIFSSKINTSKFSKRKCYC